MVGILLTALTMPFIVVPPVFLYGYSIRNMRRIILEDSEPYLPEWDVWGRLIVDGLKLAVLGFVVFLPAWFIIIGNSALLMGLQIPMETYFGFSGQQYVLFFLLSTGFIGFGFFGSLISSLLFSAVLGHVAATGEFGAAFRVREWWRIFQANISGFLVANLALYVFSFIIVFVSQILFYSIILCCVSPLFSAAYSFYLQLITSTLYAQAYRDGVKKLVGE